MSTPRTDALLAQFHIDGEGRDHDPPFAELARTLERELAEARQIEESDGELRRELDAKLAQSEAYAAAVTEALQRIHAAYDDTEALPTPLLNIARAAIAKATGEKK